MKLLSFALIAGVAVAGYTHAQTATQPPAATPSASSPAASSSASGSQAPASSASGSERLGHACKQEVHKVCGRTRGQEMQDCIKSGLDLNKFSADCKTKLMQSAKPSG